jgi:hypothetical protein
VSTRLLVQCGLGVVAVDTEMESVELLDLEELPARPPVETGLPLVVEADRLGARIVAVVGRRPPLVVSDDAGITWRETGGGLPSGRAVAIDDDHPDHVAFAGSERIYVSTDGGVFWRRLELELPAIEAAAWAAA